MLYVDHITNKPRVETVRHRHGELIRESSTKVDEKWTNNRTPVVEPFVLDIGGVQAGWEDFIKGEGRVTVLASPTEPVPDRPSDKAGGILSIPIASKELQGRCDLIADNVYTTAGFKRLWDTCQAAQEAANGLIPVVRYIVGGDEDGEPRFQIVQWVPRPPLFGARLIPLKTPSTQPASPDTTTTQPDTSPSPSSDKLKALLEKQKAAQANHAL